MHRHQVSKISMNSPQVQHLHQVFAPPAATAQRGATDRFTSAGSISNHSYFQAFCSRVSTGTCLLFMTFRGMETRGGDNKSNTHVHIWVGEGGAFLLFMKPTNCRFTVCLLGTRPRMGQEHHIGLSLSVFMCVTLAGPHN